MDVAVKKGRKYEQVLDGARQVFLKDGFEGASVDDIAKAANVSKATLYSYFSDKRLLFAEVARAECERQADHVVGMLNPEIPVRDAMRLAGQHLIGFLTSDLGKTTLALCAAESKRFPELGAEFYCSGPQLLRERLTVFLAHAVEAGKLQIEDLDLAADQFAELCKTNFFPRILCGVQTTFSEAELTRVLDGAVDMFMARYGVPGQ